MPNPLAKHPPWRQLAIISIAVPIVAALAVLVFTWPAGRTAPRDVPLGVVGSSPATQSALAELTKSEPGAYDLHLYADTAAARHAIEDRDVYGALDITPSTVTVYTASAAGPTVAQLLTATGQRVGAGRPVHTVDVVPTSTDDPRGAVFSSTLLPLSICATLVAAVVAVLLGLRSAWRQITALVVVSAGVGLGVWLVAQEFLGALPHDGVASWGALSLMVLAISSAAAGLVALFGSAGLGIATPVMVFVGNAFSGATSAPELLPKAAGDIGQWLPPGAGASLLRSTAYFDGNGAVVHVAVLAAWSVVGLVAVVVGQRGSAGFAASTAEPAEPAEPDGYAEPHARHSADGVPELVRTG